MYIHKKIQKNKNYKRILQKKTDKRHIEYKKVQKEKIIQRTKGIKIFKKNKRRNKMQV